MPPHPNQKCHPCRRHAVDAGDGRPPAGRHRAVGADGMSSLRGRRRRRRGNRRHRHRRPIAAATTEAAAAAAAEAAAATAAEAAAITTVAALVAVALAHHHRGFGLVRLDLDGEKTENLGGEAHAPLHLGHGRRRSIEVEQREVGLAALLDLVGEAFDAPVLALGDLAATLLDEVGEFFGECLDLGVAKRPGARGTHARREPCG